MLPASMLSALLSTALLSSAVVAVDGPDPALEARVVEIFEGSCTDCHDTDDPSSAEGIDLGAPGSLIGRAAVDAPGKILVVAGNPDASYLLTKMIEGAPMEGDLMPLGGDPLPPEQIEAVRSWIAGLASAGPALPPKGGTPKGPGQTRKIEQKVVEQRRSKPFHGTHQSVLPTTYTLGKRTLQYRIDHRFGRIGTERGAFGLDAGVSMAMHMQYGILDGWDVMLRRANSRKTWELGTKYVPIRQEEGAGVSFGGYGSLSVLRDFDVGNRVSGDFMVMVSRQWFERWTTMVTAGYHLRTNHNARVTIDFGDGKGPVPAKDTRDTVTIGFANSVWLGKRKRWGIDLEYFLPIPDGSDPNAFYYRGGDTDPGLRQIGSWSIGGSYYTGKHYFQVMLTNNRELSTNLAAPGGQTDNPFGADTDTKNPFHRANFFLGFNLARRFTLGKRVDKLKEKRATEAESRKGRRKR